MGFLQQIVSKRTLSHLLSMMLLCLGLFAANAQAEMVTTQSLLVAEQTMVDRQHLMAQLQTDEAKNQLLALGVSQDAAMERLASLTDTELLAFNQQLEASPAGAGIGIGTLLVLALIGFIVTDAVCLTDVFTFIDCNKQ